MCGILGTINHNLDAAQARAMLQCIAHRGPDDNDVYQSGPVTFGHVRLSIQDLSRNGHQPMHSAEGQYTIIFNGEIYNHWEIRKGLEQQGYQFKSSSDTETLLYAYIAYGKDCLQMLNGIFAFAIHDKKQNAVFIARDHFGVKPLYYAHNGNQFAFSSELKAIIGLDNIDKTLDYTALYQYLLLLWCPGTQTPFRGVTKLLPGHCGTLYLDRPQQFIPEAYYTIPFNGQYENLPEAEWMEKLDAALTTAVDRQLLSDVPVGFFLSGGLDSSLLAAMARKLYPDRLLKAYTIDTGNISKSEGFATDLPYAQKVARHIGAELEIIPADINIIRDFDSMIWHLDEPQADAAPLNVYNITRAAQAQGYKVLIGGTAGDDVFSGYRRHQALRMEQYLQYMPSFLRGGIKAATGLLPNNTTARRIKKAAANIGQSSLHRRIGHFFWMQPEQICSLFTQDVQAHINKQAPYDFYEGLLKEIPNERNHLNQMLFWELRSFLPDHNLNYTDKLSMATGVETRVPFLDQDLVNLSTRIPPGLKMKGSETKYILKKVAEAYLPHEVIYRPKTGFIAPIRQWIQHDMQDMIRERLLSDSLDKWQLFDRAAIQKLVDRNKRGEVDGAYTIWSLLAIESWLRQFAQ